MNTELYDKWLKSHQLEDDNIDITDTVMAQIGEKVCTPNVLRQRWENLLLDLMQAKIFVRISVLTSGALMGLLRMMFQIYSGLFI